MTQSIDFSTVLAAAVHDMKSSLNLLQQSIDAINEKVGSEDDAVAPFLSTAHYEAARLNTGLVQLLSLYRAEMENLPINEDECDIEDLLEDVFITHERYLRHKNITMELRQQKDLFRYLDKDLVRLLLNDIFVNAMRYGKQKILVTAEQVGDWLIIRVEDDGEGYPQSMLERHVDDMQNLEISEGRTGLGLFFARLIAAAHRRGNRQGEIVLENGGELGGSVFTLKLP